MAYMVFRVDVRERWRSKRMIVKKWLVNEVFDPKQPICEIEVDGVSRTLNGRQLEIDYPQFRQNGTYLGDFGLIRYLHVAEGGEIGPKGVLFELEGTTRLPEGPGPSGPPRHAKSRLVFKRRDRYPSIFVNYRREDSDAYAGRLHEVLVQAFTEDEVFFDEFSIRSGDLWDWTLQQAVVHARIVVALIGRRWFELKEGESRRIDLPDDPVRRELMAAIDCGTVVVPVLLPDARVPRPEDFKSADELQVLTDFQFHQFTAPRSWRAEVGDLVNVLRAHLA